MKEKILIIGSPEDGHHSALISAIRKANSEKEIVLVGSIDNFKELDKEIEKEFRSNVVIEKPKVEELVNVQVMHNYYDFKDGRTNRRERRKKNRKQKWK